MRNLRHYIPEGEKSSAHLIFSKKMWRFLFKLFLTFSEKTFLILEQRSALLKRALELKLKYLNFRISDFWQSFKIDLKKSSLWTFKLENLINQKLLVSISTFNLSQSRKFNWNSLKKEPRWFFEKISPQKNRRFFPSSQHFYLQLTIFGKQTRNLQLLSSKNSILWYYQNVLLIIKLWISTLDVVFWEFSW